MTLLIKDKDIVVPGEDLADGMGFLPSNGTYRENEKIVASRLGIINIEGKVIKIIPLTGKYMPKRGDTIIGKVVDVAFSGWRVELNCAYSAMLGLKDATSSYIAKGADLTQYFDLGDYIVANIINVTSQKLVDLTTKGPGLRKLHGGRIININTNKVPRVIGKAGSMVSMIKKATNCNITVGQNGVVWVQGEPEKEIIAVNAIKKIEQEAHKNGLTEKIKQYLEKETGIKLDVSNEGAGVMANV